MPDPEVSELNAEIAGQKVSLKSVALNTLATLATLIFVGWCLVILLDHKTDARAASAAHVAASDKQTEAIVKALDKVGDKLDEQARVARKQACLLELPQVQRERGICDRISQ